jgi:sulfatase maturation enzyme AslB (radical SAM superfamily)
MNQAPEFSSLEEMQSSSWLHNTKLNFDNNAWPKECIRCQETEQINNTSIRLNALAFDKKQTVTDYLTIGGVLDNVCNSACQTCNENLSTKIGNLKSRDYVRVDNSARFWTMPLHRVVHLDINGGEPSASKNYRHILKNIPDSVRSVRINTNCSVVMTEVEELIKRGIHVTVTVSLDGLGRTHNYVRWPIEWKNFERNLMTYQNMNVDLNTWTTVSALNIGNLKNIFSYTQQHNLKNSWALLETPAVLSVKHHNHLTASADVPEELKTMVATGKNNTAELQAWIQTQDRLRGIKFQDYQ